MRVLPTRKQWKKWSFPTKLGVIAAYIAIISFVILIIGGIDYVLTSKAPKTVNYKKIYHELGQGLLSFSYGLFDAAQLHLKNALDRIPEEDLKDIYVWLCDSYSRNGEYEESYNILKKYYETVDKNVTFEELQNLALIRFANLFKNKEFDRLLDYTIKVFNGNEISNLKETEVLAYLINRKEEEVERLLKAENYIFERNGYLRRTQYDIWKIFSYYFSSYSEQFKYFLSLMFQKNTNPEKFEIDYFCKYIPFGNLTMQSLYSRLMMQNKFDSTLSKLNNSDNLIFSKYKDNIIRFGLNIGSKYCLKQYLNDFQSFNSLLFSKMSKVKKEEEIDLIFCPKQKNNKLYILWVSGEPRWYNEPKLDEALFLGKIYLRLIEFDKDSFNISKIDFPDYDDPMHFWIYITPIENEKYDFLAIKTTGSGHFKNIYSFSIDKLSVENIYPIEGLIDSYHSHNTYIYSDNGDIKISWNFELYSLCEANANRKVYGLCEYCLRKDGILENTSIYFPNPALEFFENLNKSKLRLQAFLTGKLDIQEKEIKDEKFKKYITLRKNFCYTRTQIDEAYLYMSEILYPKISCLLIHYPSYDEISSLENTDLEDEIKEEAYYLILVKKYEDEIKILDIFETNVNYIVKSVIFDYKN